MTREEIVEGLRHGRTLYQDGWANESDRSITASLLAEGLVTKERRYGDQYTVDAYRWNHDVMAPSPAPGNAPSP